MYYSYIITMHYGIFIKFITLCSANFDIRNNRNFYISESLRYYCFSLCRYCMFFSKLPSTIIFEYYLSAICCMNNFVIRRDDYCAECDEE